MALGEGLQNQIKIFFPKNPTFLIKSYSEANLLKEMAELYEAKSSWRNIVIIGHSNKHEIKIASDRSVSWEALANWIEGFDPRRIILLACEAGRWLPCSALFNNLDDLDEIFGSPIPAYKDQQYAVLAQIAHILGVSKQSPDLTSLIQMGNFLLTKGIMFKHTRKDYERTSDQYGEVWTGFEDILSDFMRGIR